MKCADPACNKEATRELLGVAMCEAYYVEALEHSAHIVAFQYVREMAAFSLKNRLMREAQSKANEERRNRRQPSA